MAKDNKIIDLQTTRGSNVNINNIKTCNTEHVAHNTTYAGKPTSKKLNDVTSSPSVTGTRGASLQDLEKEVVEARKQRDEAHLNKPSIKKFKEDKADYRERVQAGKEASAKAIINADYIHRIEVSVHKKSTSASIKLNIDVLQEAGGYFQKFTAKCQNRRARDINQSIPPKYRDWEGYEYAKEAIRDGANAGKICLRQNSRKQTQIASKVIPQAVAVFCVDTMEVEVLLGDKTYTIPLEECNLEWYGMKGILQNEKAEEWMEL